MGVYRDVLIEDGLTSISVLASTPAAPQKRMDQGKRCKWDWDAIDSSRSMPCNLSCIASNLCLPASQDHPYLGPIIREIEAERTEREDLEAMQITKPKRK